MSTLVVMAHPDDEVLGCGGLVAGLVASGRFVRTCLLSGSVEARERRPELLEIREDIASAHQILGAAQPILGDFPNLAFNTTAHVELVRFIESAVAEAAATTIVTHHPADVNDDHQRTAAACMAAARLSQRRSGVPELRALLFAEVPSATDWTMPGPHRGFEPTTFFPLGDTLLERKIAALRAYRGVMRDFPHPRSETIIKGLAAFRGGQAGVKYAEAFQVAFMRADCPLFG